MTNPIELNGRVIGAVWHLDPPGCWRAIHNRTGRTVTASDRDEAEWVVVGMEREG